jgi:hypothetical protein
MPWDRLCAGGSTVAAAAAVESAPVEATTSGSFDPPEAQPGTKNQRKLAAIVELLPIKSWLIGRVAGPGPVHEAFVS